MGNHSTDHTHKMKYSARRFLLLITVILLGCAAAGCGNKVQTSALKVGILTGDIRQLPYYVAREKGFFKDAGLEVKKETVFVTGAELMTAITAGQIDIGYVDPGSPMVFAARNLADVRALAQSTEGGSSLVVKNSLEAEDMTALREQRVAVPGNSTLEDFLLKTALKKAKMTENDISIVTVQPYDMVSYLSAGSIEAFMGFEPYPGIAQADGAGRVIMTSDDIDKNVTSSLLVVDSSFADSNPDTVSRIKSAHEKAIEFIKENQLEAADLGNLKIGQGKDTTRRAVKNIKYKSRINMKSLEEYADFLKDTGAIDLNVDDFINHFVIDD